MTTTTGFKVSFGRPTIEKDDDAILDYVLDLTDWLAPTGSLLADNASAECEGIGCASVLRGADSKSVVLWMVGGVVGAQAKAEVWFQTTDTPPRSDTRTLFFKIVAR